MVYQFARGRRAGRVIFGGNGCTTQDFDDDPQLAGIIDCSAGRNLTVLVDVHPAGSMLVEHVLRRDGSHQVLVVDEAVDTEAGYVASLVAEGPIACSGRAISEQRGVFVAEAHDGQSSQGRA